MSAPSLTPSRAYAALIALSTVDEPSVAQQARMRRLARFLFGVAVSARRQEAA